MCRSTVRVVEPVRRLHDGIGVAGSLHPRIKAALFEAFVSDAAVGLLTLLDVS